MIQLGSATVNRWSLVDWWGGGEGRMGEGVKREFRGEIGHRLINDASWLSFIKASFVVTKAT